MEEGQWWRGDSGGGGRVLEGRQWWREWDRVVEGESSGGGRVVEGGEWWREESGGGGREVEGGEWWRRLWSELVVERQLPW